MMDGWLDEEIIENSKEAFLKHPISHCQSILHLWFPSTHKTLFYFIHYLKLSIILLISPLLEYKLSYVSIRTGDSKHVLNKYSLSESILDKKFEFLKSVNCRYKFYLMTNLWLFAYSVWFSVQLAGYVIGCYILFITVVFFGLLLKNSQTTLDIL